MYAGARRKSPRAPATAFTLPVAPRSQHSLDARAETLMEAAGPVTAYYEAAMPFLLADIGGRPIYFMRPNPEDPSAYAYERHPLPGFQHVRIGFDWRRPS
jgi:hypothetical protein